MKRDKHTSMFYYCMNSVCRRFMKMVVPPKEADDLSQLKNIFGFNND